MKPAFTNSVCITVYRIECEIVQEYEIVQRARTAHGAQLPSRIAANSAIFMCKIPLELEFRVVDQFLSSAVFLTITRCVMLPADWTTAAAAACMHATVRAA